MTAGRSVVTVEADHAPTLSICVVLYGGGHLALDALASVVERTTVPYEVIVVDNCSPDGSGSLVRARTRGVRFVANRVNVGFGGAMNQAAEAARGRYLCLLNPDAIVTDGWAEPLIARLRDRPGVGAVSPLLLEPDGQTVQEAGSFVDRTGYTFPIGTAMAGPLGPDAIFARVCDYASAACLVLDRGAFEQSGGFDLRFRPAYFEDADLAFTLAEHGWQTWFEPASRVRHARGGTDANGRALALVAANHPRFVEKWGNELVRRPAFDLESSGDGLALRDWRAARRVLVVDDGACEPPGVVAVAGRWLTSSWRPMVTVVSAQPRPPDAGDVEWLTVADGNARSRLVEGRSAHYDAIVNVDLSTEPVDEAALPVERPRSPHSGARDRYRWPGSP